MNDNAREFATFTLAQAQQFSTPDYSREISTFEALTDADMQNAMRDAVQATRMPHGELATLLEASLRVQRVSERWADAMRVVESEMRPAPLSLDHLGEDAPKR
jgi:hypothetical protein